MDLGGGNKKDLSSSPMEDSRSSSWSSMINGDSEDQVNDDMNNNNKKSCADCRTTKTPLWRGGPSGPKSLCNACGIRYRKKMVSVMRLRKGNEKIKRERTQTHHIIYDDDDHNATISPKTTKTSESLKVKLNLMALVKKQRCRRKRKLAEEEEAAVLLMALSCGSVFA